MTIDELAHRCGTPASTIRLYQTRGLLRSPVRQGRVGYYDDGHVARLQLIDQLQDDGFSLASIGRLVEAWENGEGLASLLGIEPEVATPWAPEEPVDLTPDELTARFPAGTLTPELMERARRLELLRVEDGRITVPSPTFLDIASALASLGIPVDPIISEHEELAVLAATVAARFIELFEEHVWAPAMQRGANPDDIRSLPDAVNCIRDSAEAAVTLTLRDALRRAAEEFVATQQAALPASALLDALSAGMRPAGPRPRSGG